MLIQGRFSPALRTRFAGGGMHIKVYGVFSGAIYLLTFTQRLIMLHDSKNGMIPFGIGVRDFARDVVPNMNVQPGTEGMLVDGVLVLDDCPVSVMLQEVCAPGASTFAPSCAERKRKMNVWSARLAEQGKSTVLPLLGGRDSLENHPFAKMAKEPLMMLSRALLTGQQAQMQKALLGLIGLGVGLTPSLDDLLNGMLYTLQFAGRNWKRELPGTADMAAAIQALAVQRTNPYSAAYLTAIAHGETFSVLEDFLDGRHFMNDVAGQRILKIGSSSGTDMMCGIILALRLLERQSVGLPA